MTQTRIAVVTGGTRGMGKAISLELAKKGILVRAIYRSDHDAALETKHQLQAINPHCDIMQADVTDEHAAANAVNQVVKQLGRIDILVNNAGIFSFRLLEEMDGGYLEHVLSCNFKSQLYMLKAAAPHMKRNRYGRVVNASSISGRFADVGLIAYATSKAGVDMMTKIAAAELGPFGITVNAYAPGIIATDMTKEMIEARGDEQVRDIAAGRFGTGPDVAALVGFLTSKASAYITGEVIGVDGGMFKVQNTERAFEHTGN